MALLMIMGCGKKEEIVIDDLSSAISANVVFSEQLTQIDTKNIERRYSLNAKDYNEIKSFVGTVSVCDEYVIVKTDAPQTMADKFNEYIKDKRDIYEAYRPNEVHKLDSAVIETYNNAVVMIVTADSENALNVYKEYLKK